MQGYIINTQQVRDEDLLVSILTQENFYTTYRFYGARHSNINIGFKIDFELETNYKSTIPRLKDVIQLGFSWIFERSKMYCWQRFLKLFYDHLKDVQEVDSFYFLLLEQLIVKLQKQDPKRAIVEAYVQLCEHEGRLHRDFECLLCENHIENYIALVRGFIPTHPQCSLGMGIEKEKLQILFNEKNTLPLSEQQIEYLWEIILQGI
ncbi:MAG: recombination protein RecO [Campylobacterales bacterium]|nr:recombination protein RecO [Campylobacterales bacterium]